MSKTDFREIYLYGSCKGRTTQKKELFEYLNTAKKVPMTTTFNGGGGGVFVVGLLGEELSLRLF